jgi:hypothetical protein
MAWLFCWDCNDSPGGTKRLRDPVVCWRTGRPFEDRARSGFWLLSRVGHDHALADEPANQGQFARVVQFTGKIAHGKIGMA